MLGNLVGSWIAYAVGYYGRLDLLEKNKLIHISPKHLKWVDDWFERYGDATVFFSPDAADRPHLHLAAGRGREDAVLALHRLHRCSARIPWVLALALIGSAVGDELGRVAPPPAATSTTSSSPRSSAGVVYLLIRRRRRAEAAEPAEPAGRAELERGADGRIPAGRALALGIVQGPAELLPVSSSAHIVLVPWLAGWDWERIDPEVRKSFEVALHAGAAAALLIGQRRLIAEELRELRPAAGAASSASPSCRRRSSATRSSARSSGGSAGRGRPRSACSPARRRCSSPTRRPQQRGRGDATPADGLALGVAQAAALAPGVSRNGVTLAAARWRRFSRDQANLLSRTIALPIIVGATVLKGARLAPPRRLAGAAPLDGDRRRRLLRLDPRLAAPDRPGRARPGALALRRLPGRPRRRRSCEAAGDE